MKFEGYSWLSENGFYTSPEIKPISEKQVTFNLIINRECIHDEDSVDYKNRYCPHVAYNANCGTNSIV